MRSLGSTREINSIKICCVALHLESAKLSRILKKHAGDKKIKLTENISMALEHRSNVSDDSGDAEAFKGKEQEHGIHKSEGKRLGGRSQGTVMGMTEAGQVDISGG